jgi:hypothetical protein
MRDRLVLLLLALVAAAMIALALVWPQGQGARSPAPFGHPLPPVQQKLRVGGRTVGAIRGPQDMPEPAAPR